MSNISKVSVLNVISQAIVKRISINKYIITNFQWNLLFLSNKSNINKSIVTNIKVNLLLVNNYKVILLLDTNVISSKKIDVITFKKYIYLGSYNIRISIKVIL